MAMENNFVTMVGNLTADPELRFTGGGAAVASLRLASNRRWTGRDGQQQEETTFVNINAWRDMAENCAETLKKGDRIIVVGRLRIRSYDDSSGQTKWVTEIEADEIAPSLRWARGTIEKVMRDKNAGGGDRGTSGGGDGPAPGPADSDAPPPTDDVPF